MAELRVQTRAEVERVNSDRDRQLGILNDMLCTERKLRKQAANAALLFKGLFVTAGACAILVTMVLLYEREHPKPWRTYRPPVNVPIQVVTTAWYNKKGEFQAYDNGEVITVKHWQPK